jgi:hypothetical protein
MGRDLTQAVAVADVRGRDPLAIVDRAGELGEFGSRRPHHRPCELGIPGYACKPLDDEDVVAGHKRMSCRRRILYPLHHHPVRTQRLLPLVAEAGEQLVDGDDSCRGHADCVAWWLVQRHCSGRLLSPARIGFLIT